MPWIELQFVLELRDLLLQELFFKVHLRGSILSRRPLWDESLFKAGVHNRAMGQGTKRPPLLWDPAATDLALAQRSRRLLNK